MSRDIREDLSRIDPVGKIKEATAGSVEIGLEFDLAQRRLHNTVVSLGDLVSAWQDLVGISLPLGANRVGEAVAGRFTEVGGQFIGMLRDYAGKLDAANTALQAVRRTYNDVDAEYAAAFSQEHRDVEDAIDSLGSGYGAPPNFLESLSWSGGWSPADRTDWTAYDSHELARFARHNNDPLELATAVDYWLHRLRDLENHSEDFAATISTLASVWRGPAADAANSALTPLCQWTGDAAGGATRICENLKSAGEAAQQVRLLPDPVDEPSLGEWLHASLAASPAEQQDVQQRHVHAQAVKGEQVRYLEQYEAAMAGVYDALPEFHLAPVATTDVEEPVRLGNPGVGYQPSGTGYSTGGPNVSETPGASSSNIPGTSGDSGVPVVPVTQQETPFHGTTAAATFTPATPSDLTGARPVGNPLNPGSGWNAGGGFLPGGGIPGGGGGFSGRIPGSGGTPGDARPGAGSATSARPTAPTSTRAPAGLGPVGNRPDREEDTEHERAPYLVERDPEGTFGTAEPTAPPVIGA